MTSEERQRKIESDGSAFPILLEGLKHFPQEMWQLQPGPNRWAIHEIVIHTRHTGDISVHGWQRGLSKGKTFLAIGDWHVIDHCQPPRVELETRQNTCHRIQSAQCDN